MTDKLTKDDVFGSDAPSDPTKSQLSTNKYVEILMMAVDEKMDDNKLISKAMSHSSRDKETETSVTLMIEEWFNYHVDEEDMDDAVLHEAQRRMATILAQRAS